MSLDSVRAFLAACSKPAVGFETSVELAIAEEAFATSGRAAVCLRLFWGVPPWRAPSLKPSGMSWEAAVLDNPVQRTTQRMLLAVPARGSRGSALHAGCHCRRFAGDVHGLVRFARHMGMQ